MRYIKFLIIFSLALSILSCEEETTNNLTQINSHAERCRNAIETLEKCLNAHPGSLSYLESNCSVRTINFIEENKSHCEVLVDYFVN